ncbi:MAG: MFS transporter [Oscillospiraceae bacterium]|nr:MFS transporter [Oscillospiraceae bacterium]
MEHNTLNDTLNHKRNFISLTIAVFASFLVLGIADNIRGTAIPRIQAEFALTELHLGLLLAVSSVGYLTACTFTATLSGKIGIRACSILSLILIAAGGTLISLSPNFPTILMSFFLVNLAFGGLDIAIGVIAAKLFTKNTGTMMNLAHFAFGAGAILSPIISITIISARFGTELTSWRYVYLIALSLALIPIIPLLIGRMKKSSEDKKKTGYGAMLRKPSIWLVVGVMLFGTLGEAGIASWFVAFLESGRGYTNESAALHLTLYFVSFTAARLILGPLIDRFGFINSLIVSTAFAAIMITTGVLLGAQGSPLIVLAGIGIAPIFPTVMAVVAKLYSDTIELAITTMMTIIGVIMIPANFLVGGIINQARVIFTSSHGEAGVHMAFSAGFLVFGFSCFLSFVFTLILRARQKKAGKLV